MYDGQIVSYADAPERAASVSFDEPPRTFDVERKDLHRHRMAAPSLLRRNEIIIEALSGISGGSYANLLQAVSLEINNSCSVSASNIDVISQIEGLIDAELRRGAIEARKASENIYEVKRLTGYSWSKIAKLVGVDRRSITTWVGGGEVRERNAEAIAEVLATLRFIDRGSADENREALTTEMPGPGGRSAYDDLANRRHDEVRAALGPGAGRHRLVSTPLEGVAKSDASSLGREMLMHPSADAGDTTVRPDDTPAPVMRRVKAKRI